LLSACRHARAVARDGGDGSARWLHLGRRRKHVEVALAHPGKVVENRARLATEDISLAVCTERGMRTSRRRRAGQSTRQSGSASGVDIVVAQGYEAGGIPAKIGSMVAHPEDSSGQRSATGWPVLAAGGIGLRPAGAPAALSYFSRSVGRRGPGWASREILNPRHTHVGVAAHQGRAQMTAAPAVQQELLAATSL